MSYLIKVKNHRFYNRLENVCDLRNKIYNAGTELQVPRCIELNIMNSMISEDYLLLFLEGNVGNGINTIAEIITKCTEGEIDEIISDFSPLAENPEIRTAGYGKFGDEIYD